MSISVLFMTLCYVLIIVILLLAYNSIQFNSITLYSPCIIAHVHRSDDELTTLFRGIHAFQKGFQLNGCCY